MSTPIEKIDQTPEFKALVTRRWTVALVLTFFTFITYYGFIITVGVSKATMSIKIGTVTTLGIPVAVGVIVISFILTLIYVLWANKTYDSMVSSILKNVSKE